MREKIKNIFVRLKHGAFVSFDGAEYFKIHKAIDQAKKLTIALNNATDADEIRGLLSQITPSSIDKNTTRFTPFYANFVKHISIGKNVFINHACSFLDLGSFTIEDNGMIAQRVNLLEKGKGTIGRILIKRRHGWAQMLAP